MLGKVSCKTYANDDSGLFASSQALPSQNAPIETQTNKDVTMILESTVFIVTISVVVLVCCVIATTIALCHTISVLAFRDQSIACYIKFVVISAMLLFYGDMLLHTIAQFIDISPYSLSQFGCEAYVVAVSICFYVGKACLFSFYTLRVYSVFKDSYQRFSKSSLIIYLLIININGIASGALWAILQLPHTKLSTYKNPFTNQQSEYCIVSATVEDDYQWKQNPLTYFLIYATLSDIIISIFTVWLFVRCLFRMSNDVYRLRKKSIGANVELDKLDYNEKKDVEIWHEYTSQQNIMLLLSTKLLILLVVAILTSQIALVLYLTIFAKIYAVDACINFFCMYLSFKFTGKIWEKIFCGNKCMEYSFPLVKMFAVASCHLHNCCKYIRCRGCWYGDDGQDQEIEVADSYNGDVELSISNKKPLLSSKPHNINSDKSLSFNRHLYRLIHQEYKLFIA